MIRTGLSVMLKQLLPLSKLPLQPVLSATAVNGAHQIHTSASSCAVSKKMMSKTRRHRKAKEEEDLLVEKHKLTGWAGTEELIKSGHFINGMHIPTEETMTTTIDGIPFNKLAIALIYARKNNTLISILDHKGGVYVKTSCGVEGFKNKKQSSTVAAQATGLSAGVQALNSGVSTVRVMIGGIGNGRRSSVEGLSMSGIRIVSLTDITNTPTTFLKPRKVRRT